MNEMYFAQFWHKQKQQIVKAVKYVGKRSGCICSLVCVTSYDRKCIINGVTTFFTFWLTTKWQKLNDKKTGLNRFEVDIVVVAEVDHLLIQIPRIDLARSAIFDEVHPEGVSHQGLDRDHPDPDDWQK